jgi:hypothetical protein
MSLNSRGLPLVVEVSILATCGNCCSLTKPQHDFHPARRFADSALHIGHFNQDLLPSRDVIRKATKEGKDIPRAPQQRRHQAPAYLKPNINWDSEGIVWAYTASRGQLQTQSMWL